jgi:uncharacterized protein
MELTPFLESEVLGLSPNASQSLWVRGGFPDSFLAETEVQSFEWRAAFIQTYLERDVPSLGPRIPAETLHRFWQMLARNQGQMLNAAQLAAGLGISGQTVARYLDIMVDLLLVRRLQPWASNVGRRLFAPQKSMYEIAAIGCGDIHATRQIVLYPGDERFKIDAKTEAMPLETLLKSEFEEGAS